jgi:hypothetical protein
MNIKYIIYNDKSGHRNVLSKRQVWMSIFHIINFKKKKKSWTQGPGFFFNKKLILDYISIDMDLHKLDCQRNKTICKMRKSNTLKN